MPFTFAHPVAVVPLVKKRFPFLDATALIIGSMAPDFEYFIHFKAQAIVGHTLGGFLCYNLPLVFAVAFLWHAIVKRPFIISLPSSLGKHLTPPYNSQWCLRSVGKYLTFVLSAFIGMFTHVLWDSFTHIDGFFVVRIPFLQKSISVFGLEIAMYQGLQQISTLLGLGIVVVVLYRTYQRNKQKLPTVVRWKKTLYWSLTISVMILVEWVHFFLAPGVSGIALFGICVVSLISAMFIGITMISFIYRMCGVYRMANTD